MKTKHLLFANTEKYGYCQFGVAQIKAIGSLDRLKQVFEAMGQDAVCEIVEHETMRVVLHGWTDAAGLPHYETPCQRAEREKAEDIARTIKLAKRTAAPPRVFGEAKYISLAETRRKAAL